MTRGAESPARRGCTGWPGWWAVVLFLTLGCGGDQDPGPVVLTVGDREVRLDEFRESFEGFLRADTTVQADTAGLRRFVDSFIDRILTETLAEEAIPELDPGPASRLAEFVERTIVETLREEEYGDAYKVSRRELERAWEKDARQLHLRYMLVEDRAGAEQIIRALREGAVFDKVARQRSLDSRSREEGGDIGWISYTDLDGTVRDKVFALQTGQIGGPYPWGEEFQIFRVEEERPNPNRRPLEDARRDLERGIILAKLQVAKRQYEEMLREKYRFRVDPAEVAWMTAFLHEKTATVKRGVPEETLAEAEEEGGIAPTPIRSELPWDRFPVAPADTGRVLAAWEGPGGRVTPILLIDQLVGHPTISWPTFNRPKDVEDLIDELVMERLEILEARNRDYLQRPEIQRRIKDQERQIRSRFFYRTQIRPQGRPTDEDARAYYEAHRQEYRTPEQRRFVAVNTASWDFAMRAMEMMRAGRRLPEVVDALASADTSLKSTGSDGTSLLKYGDSPLLDRFIFNLPPGGVSDPIPVGTTFTVAKVVEIVPESFTPFDEVRTSILARIGAARADSLLAGMIAEARGTTQIEVRWNLLRPLLEEDRGTGER